MNRIRAPGTFRTPFSGTVDHPPSLRFSAVCRVGRTVDFLSISALLYWRIVPAHVPTFPVPVPSTLASPRLTTYHAG